MIATKAPSLTALSPHKDITSHYNQFITHYTGRWIADNSNVEFGQDYSRHNTWNENDGKVNYNTKEEDEVIGKNDEEILPGGRIITPSNYRPLSSTQACVITIQTLHCFNALH